MVIGESRGLPELLEGVTKGVMMLNSQVNPGAGY